jgi:serine/threonine-protein kinase RsbW
VYEAQLDTAITIPSVRTNIQLVERFLLDIDRLVGLGDDVLDRVMISVTEVVNNAIIHGNRSDPGRMVHLLCICFQDRVEFTVQDEGGGFDPDALPDPREERNLLREGGRGILIIRAMMDEVSFQRNEQGMRVFLMARRMRRDTGSAD